MLPISHNHSRLYLKCLISHDLLATQYFPTVYSVINPVQYSSVYPVTTANIFFC